MLAGLQAGQSRFVAADARLLDAELRGPDELAFVLGAPVPRDWPPATRERGAVRRLRDHLRAHPDEVGWWTAYLVSHDGIVVGTAGLTGRPVDGEVAVVYALVRSATGMGYATDAVTAIVAAARARGDLVRVSAVTAADADDAQGVLRRAGFVADGDGPRPGTRRFVVELGSSRPAR